MTTTQLHNALDRIERLDKLMWARATRTSGLGAARNVWHNAMLARESGKPWQDTDYQRLRQAIRIDRLRYELVSGLRTRLYAKVPQ